MTPRNKDQKSSLRMALRTRRKRISHSSRQILDMAINQHLLEFIDGHQPKTIAAFWPFDGEPDLLPALGQASRQGVQLTLPVIRQDGSGRSIIFRHWSPEQEMTKNHFGIPEPCGTHEALIVDIDLILMPMVGWDESGRRLGMGAGYYDRALEPLALKSAPLRMGVAYQAQKTNNIPDDPWDIRLHHVLSESGCHNCPAC